VMACPRAFVYQYASISDDCHILSYPLVTLERGRACVASCPCPD